MPPEYINKLSQMFKDIKVSNDINDKFKTVARNNLHNNNLAGELTLRHSKQSSRRLAKLTSTLTTSRLHQHQNLERWRLVKKLGQGGRDSAT